MTIKNLVITVEVLEIKMKTVMKIIQIITKIIEINILRHLRNQMLVLE